MLADRRVTRGHTAGENGLRRRQCVDERRTLGRRGSTHRRGSRRHSCGSRTNRCGSRTNGCGSRTHGRGSRTLGRGSRTHGCGSRTLGRGSRTLGRGSRTHEPGSEMHRIVAQQDGVTLERHPSGGNVVERRSLVHRLQGDSQGRRRQAHRCRSDRLPARSSRCAT